MASMSELRAQAWVALTDELLASSYPDAEGQVVRLIGVAGDDPEGDRELMDHLTGGYMGLCLCEKCKRNQKRQS